MVRICLKQEDVVAVAQHTRALFDTIAAVVAALVIIPACFSYGLDVGAGPGLLFVTLAHHFAGYTHGSAVRSHPVCAMIFAGVSSLQNMFEAVAESLLHKFPKLSRTAVLRASCACYAWASASAWRPSRNGGRGWILVSIYIIPIGATLGAVSWFYVMKKDVFLEAVNEGVKTAHGKAWYAVGRYIYVPLAVILCAIALFEKVAF